MKRRTFRMEAAPAPLLGALASELGLSSQDARRLIESGAVYVGGRRCLAPERVLPAGSTVSVVLEEAGQEALSSVSAPTPLRLLFEDDCLVAVDKAAGITAQPTPSRVGASLLDQVSLYLKRPAGLVHRLDRETSGVTVFGKTDEATSALAAQFREGRAVKQYVAVTGPGLSGEGSISLPLSKDPSRPGRFRASAQANGVSAHTDFVVLYASPAFCIVQLRPKTGRTHQLRAHLTALGAPILGDARYGGAAHAGALTASRCLLHAQRLALPHPRSGADLTLTAPVPEDLACFFRAGKVPLS